MKPSKTGEIWHKLPQCFCKWWKPRPDCTELCSLVWVFIIVLISIYVSISHTSTKRYRSRQQRWIDWFSVLLLSHCIKAVASMKRLTWMKSRGNEVTAMQQKCYFWKFHLNTGAIKLPRFWEWKGHSLCMVITLRICTKFCKVQVSWGTSFHEQQK